MTERLDRFTVAGRSPPTYCPACFAQIPAEAAACPACGQDLARLSHRDYREKLLAALHHPLADVRLRAIIALGWRREPEAAQALAECALRHPIDVVQGLEVVESLRIIDGDPGREALERLARDHPAHAVRARAEEARTR